MSSIDIFAGKSAMQHLQNNGLQPQDISTVFAASGAAKWLAIYGLDKTIFTDWLPRGNHPVKMFGTSVGAFKLAAACHNDAAAGLTGLAQAYIHQHYDKGIDADEIDREFKRIVDSVVTDGHVEQILNHPNYHFSCGAVRCHGGLRHDGETAQKIACAIAAFKNILGRSGLKNSFDRVVFHDPRVDFPIVGRDGYNTESVELTPENFLPALKASGSIPVYMHSVKDIAGAGAGVYRDGGMLDYHPLPSNLWNEDGLVLYPHFYPHCKEGWFDKFMPWRHASAEQLDNVLMISPSQEFLANTELGRIPDREDFLTYAGKDAERIRLWQEVTDKSLQMGEDFLAWVESGDLMAKVKPFPV